MFDTLNETMFLLDGAGNKWLRGKVVTNVDPLNLDRIQVSVPGLYDPDLGPVPWIGALKHSPFGIGDGYGVYGSPAVGSDVAIRLQDGDVHYPEYCSLQAFANGEFPSGQSWGFKDPAGNKLIVQGKDVVFQTGGGFIFHIDQSGNFTLTVPGGGSGTMNVDNLTMNTKKTVLNAQDFTVNASDLTTINGKTHQNGEYDVVGPTNIQGTTSIQGAANINGSTVDTSGNTRINGGLITNGTSTLIGNVGMLNGMSVTGAALNNGKNIGGNHEHSNVRSGSDISGPPV